MNKSLKAGWILTGAGVVLLILGNMGFKRQEDVFRLGGLTATATTTKTFPGLRYAGVACLGGGGVLLAMGYRQRRK